MKRIIAACCGLACLVLLLAPTAEGKTLRTRSQDRNIPDGEWCPLGPLANGANVFRFQADGPSAFLTLAVNDRPSQRIADVFVVEESEYEPSTPNNPDCAGQAFDLSARTAVFVESFASDANGWSLAGAGFAPDSIGPDGGGSLALDPGGSAGIIFTGLQKGHTYVVGCSWYTEGAGNVLSLSVDTLDPAALYLADGRFKVEATWRTSPSKAGVGQAVPMTGDTGYFWFFDPANVEVTVKVINACLFNHRYWIFASGLTNVRVDLRITDTVHGTTKTYTNPQGASFKPIQDTGAFACP